jgi:hypothetical protein
MGGFLSIGTGKHRCYKLGIQHDHGGFLIAGVAAPGQRRGRLNRLICIPIATLGMPNRVPDAGLGKKFRRLGVQCDHCGLGLLLAHDDDDDDDNDDNDYDYDYDYVAD